jgi:response regulator NasT
MPDTPSSSAPRGRILVVDDDRLVLATLTHGLAQAGYEVIDADNGDDAILLAREHRPDLALLDIRMEGKSGFDVAAYLREYLGIPFMFLSAFSDEATVAQVRALGAVAYLVKPLDISQIVPAVGAAFGQLRQQPRAAARMPAGTSAPASVPSLPGAPAPAPLPVPAAAARGGADPLSQTVAIAVGVVMHRYSLPRQAALERLRRVAEHERRTLEEAATRMVEALEQLTLPGGL